MKKSVFAIAIAATMGASFAAAQQPAYELSYDYVEIGYIARDTDFIDFDGVGVNASVSLSENVYLLGSYSDLESDKIFGYSLDLKQYNVGLGYRHQLNQGTDLNLAASWLRGEVSESGPGYNSGDFSGTGYDLRVGLRHMLSTQVELAGSVVYSELEDADGTSLDLGILYHINPVLGLGAGYIVGDDTDGWQVGVRLKF